MKPNTVGRAGGQDPQTQPVSPHPRLGADPAGFLSGTILLGQDGEIPVEYLSPGDRIITRDAGMVRLNAVTRHLTTQAAIFFAAGSLGDTRPDRDLILPAGQRVLIRDWRAQAMFGAPQALVRADALVDNEFVRDLGLRQMHLFQLEFDRPHVVYAGGLELAGALTDQPGLRQAA